VTGKSEVVIGAEGEMFLKEPLREKSDMTPEVGMVGRKTPKTSKSPKHQTHPQKPPPRSKQCDHVIQFMAGTETKKGAKKGKNFKRVG